MEVQLEIAYRVGLLPLRDFERLSAKTDEVGRMLNGLLNTVQADLEP